MNFLSHHSECQSNGAFYLALFLLYQILYLHSVLLGQVEGEGGCAHAAAHGKCEKSSLYHKECCDSCELHRDILQKAESPYTMLSLVKLFGPSSCRCPQAAASATRTAADTCSDLPDDAFK